MGTKKKTKNTEPYARNLKAHIGKQPYGYITKLAKEAGISQGYLSNIADGKREGSETVRRTLAQKIGIPYDEMIGLKELSSPESETDVKLQPESETEEEVIEAQKKTIAILESQVAGLEKDKNRLLDRIKTLEAQLDGACGAQERGRSQDQANSAKAKEPVLKKTH